MDTEQKMVLSVLDVSVHFGGLVALDSMRFDMATGEVLGVIGPNGAGKSTLINVITGIYPAAAGDVRFHDGSLKGLKPYQISRLGVVRTFQSSRLFTGLSILDNILIGMHQHMSGGILAAVFTYGRVRKELKRASDEARSIMEVIDPQLCDRMHELVENLSHGDKRRVEVARALAARPRLLLLDEPAAGMGVGETAKFIDDMNRIRALRPALSILIIEHDMALISRFPDRVLVMNYGRSLAMGSFEEVSQIESVRSAYLGTSA